MKGYCHGTAGSAVQNLEKHWLIFALLFTHTNSDRGDGCENLVHNKQAISIWSGMTVKIRYTANTTVLIGQEEQIFSHRQRFFFFLHKNRLIGSMCFFCFCVCVVCVLTGLILVHHRSGYLCSKYYKRCPLRFFVSICLYIAWV